MKSKILFVDDDRDFADSVKNVLKNEDVKLYHRDRAATALELLAEENSVDIVILDLELPDCNGKDFIKKLNKDYKHVKIIILTGHPNLLPNEHAISLGIHSYLEKPIGIQTLKFSIKNALLQSKLDNAKKMALVGSLSTSVAHDVNNALVPISTNAQFIRENLESLEPGRLKAGQLKEYIETSLEEIGVIIQSTRHCSDIVNNLMLFAREEKVEKKKINLYDILEECLLAISHHKDITISKNLKNDIPLFADKDQLKRVFNNILKNAVEALQGKREGDKEISVKAVPRKNKILLEFRDNGAGISKKSLAHVFDPAFSMKKGMGMGLGLSIAKNIIEGEYAGKIDIESQRYKYTVVSIMIPLPS
ncbi:MAG: response regulator [bacterium]|nr:response regulator [bacterium]